MKFYLPLFLGLFTFAAESTVDKVEPYDSIELDIVKGKLTVPAGLNFDYINSSDKDGASVKSRNFKEGQQDKNVFTVTRPLRDGSKIYSKGSLIKEVSGGSIRYSSYFEAVTVKNGKVTQSMDCVGDGSAKNERTRSGYKGLTIGRHCTYIDEKICNDVFRILPGELGELHSVITKSSKLANMTKCPLLGMNSREKLICNKVRTFVEATDKRAHDYTAGSIKNSSSQAAKNFASYEGMAHNNKSEKTTGESYANIIKMRTACENTMKEDGHEDGRSAGASVIRK